MNKQIVPVSIEGRNFQCVRLADADFRDVAAVYVIICVYEGGTWDTLDVGQTGELDDRIDSHGRQKCWKENCPHQNIWVCVYSMPSPQFTLQERLELEKELRANLNPPCGKR